MRGRRVGLGRYMILPTAVFIVSVIALHAVATSGTTCRKNNCPSDSTAPSIRIAKPLSGEAVSGTVKVAGTASDDVQLTKVEISVDDGRFRKATGTADWSYPVDTTTLRDGSHVIVVRATDLAGNSNKTSIELLVANTSPPPAGSSGEPSPAPAPEPSPTTEPEPEPAPAPEPSPEPSPTTEPAPAPNPDPPPSTSTYMVTPEGVTIDVAPDVTAWTAQQIYDLLQASARDLSAIGPSLTIKVQTTYATSTTTSVSQTGGTYSNFKAIIYLRAKDGTTFTTYPDASVAHEYGHAWTLYWYYMAHGADWTPLLQARGLEGDPRLNSSYNWTVKEIVADDYRLLFGSPTAISQRNHINADIPDPRTIDGYRDWLVSSWAS